MKTVPTILNANILCALGRNLAPTLTDFKDSSSSSFSHRQCLHVMVMNTAFLSIILGPLFCFHGRKKSKTYPQDPIWSIRILYISCLRVFRTILHETCVIKAEKIKDSRQGSADRGCRQATQTVDDTSKTVHRRHNIHQ